MTIAELTETVHDATGATGPELQTKVFFIAMTRAVIVKDEAAILYFERRMRESYELWQGTR